MTTIRSLRFVALLLALALPVFSLAQARQEITLADDVLAQYVGSYQLAPNVVMAMRLEDGQLTTQLPGQQAFPVFAESETRFFLKVVDATLDFQKDSNGKVTGVTLTQNGRSTTAPKVSNEPPAKVTHTEITLAEDVLMRYVGSYALAPNFILTITFENGQLMSQATGQAKVAIFPETETRFFLKVVEATLDFQVDAAGTVTGLVLNQSGQSIPAPRQ